MSWLVDFWKELTRLGSANPAERRRAMRALAITVGLAAAAAICAAVIAVLGNGPTIQIGGTNYIINVYRDRLQPIAGQPPAVVIPMSLTPRHGPGKAKLEAILLLNNVAWAFGSSSAFEDPRGGTAPPDLDAILADPGLAKRLRKYKEVWALGLVSGVGNPSKQESLRLGAERALNMCNILAQRPYLKGHSVNGVSLGDHLDTSPQRESLVERGQRSIVIFGLVSETGNIDRQAALQDVLRNDRIFTLDGKALFRTSFYELVAKKKRLEFVSADWDSTPAACRPY